MARYQRHRRCDRKPHRLSRAGADWRRTTLNHDSVPPLEGTANVHKVPETAVWTEAALERTEATYLDRKDSVCSPNWSKELPGLGDYGKQALPPGSGQPDNEIYATLKMGRARVTSATAQSSPASMMSRLSVGSLVKPTLAVTSEQRTAPKWSTDEVHPLFLKGRFCQHTPYEAIFPAVKLATRLLRTPQAIYYLHAIFFGVNKVVPGDTAEEVHPVRSIHELTPADYESVWNDLAAMADDTRIVVRDELRAMELQGQTTYRPSLLTGDHRQTPCLILIDAKELINPLRLDKEYTSDSRARNVARLAITLIHEAAHVAQAWAVGGQRAEDYFQDSLCAESGYELERQIFGGVVAIFTCEDFEKFGYIGYIGRWPTQKDAKLEDRIRNNDQLAEDRHWRLDMSFLRDLQSDEWWLVAAKDPRKLIPRDVQMWIEYCAQKGKPSGVPVTLERLCRPSSHDIMDVGQRFGREPKSRTRAVTQPPQLYARCCKRSLHQFSEWTRGHRAATTRDDAMRWRTCLSWLRPAEEHTATEIETKLLTVASEHVAHVRECGDFPDCEFYHCSAWPLDRTPETFFPILSITEPTEKMSPQKGAS
nr:hypothetical protein B0A51_14318 [Rachicladosporium sp. CCFEE 5018]